MAAQEKNVIKDLIEQGKAKGKLTTSEITDALDELDFDVEQMEKLTDSILLRGVTAGVSAEKGGPDEAGGGRKITGKAQCSGAPAVRLKGKVGN